MIRGLTGPRVLMLDDGLRLEDYSWSDEDGPSVDSRLAERIEVIRGPASVLYGSDAIGGVINVVPEEVPDARGEKPFVNGAAEAYGATNNGEIGGLVRAKGGSGSIGFRATAIGRHAGNFHTPKGNEQTPTGDIFDTGYGSLNGELAVGYHGDRRAASRSATSATVATSVCSMVRPWKTTTRADRCAGSPTTGYRAPPTGSWASTRASRPRASTSVTRSRSSWATVAPAMTRRRSISCCKRSRPMCCCISDHASWLTGTIGASGLYQDNKSMGVFPLVPNARTTNGALFAFEQATKGSWSFLAGVRGNAHHITADANDDLQLDRANAQHLGVLR